MPRAPCPGPERAQDAPMLSAVLWMVLSLGATDAASVPSTSTPVPTAVCLPALQVLGSGLPEAMVASFAADAAALVDDLRLRTGDVDCRPITITLVRSMDDAGRLEPPWRLPPWAAGAAQAETRRVVVGVSAEGRVQDRRRTLHHELAHVVVRSAAGGADLPRWLDEGLARVLAGEHGIDDLRVLAQARLGDRFLPFAALETGFPDGAADAGLAYAQAGRAVSLMQDHEAAIPRLLQLVRDGSPVDDALRQATGRATWQWDLDVRRSVSLWGALAATGVETDLAMAGCGVVVAVFGVKARRRQRRRMIDMDDEGPISPAAAAVALTRWTVARTTC